MSGFPGVIALLFDESPSFNAPAAFGTYRVLHQVGSGVLGPVFRTSDPRRPDLVAIKAFRLDLRPEEVVKLADALRRLAAKPPVHPVLAAVVDAGLEGTTPFLATEYLIGDTLDVVLRRRAPLALDETTRLLAPVAEALDRAWSQGVGHGALHPRDVFVGPEGEVRLTGVGVMQALQQAGLSAPGRRPYTAPERAGQAWDQRADVYSLAVIAHELLTGRRPAGATEQDGVFASEVTPEQRVAIRRVLSSALADQPDGRFASAQAFLEALGAADVSAGPDRAQVVAAIDARLDAAALRAVDDLPAAVEVPIVHRVPADVPIAPPAALDPDVFSPPPARVSASDGLLLDPGRPPAAPRRLPIVDDLAYRPVTRDDEPRAVPVPGWMPSVPEPAPARPRWGMVVIACLILGSGVGYFAATYDPLGQAEANRLAERDAAQPAATAPADVVPQAPAITVPPEPEPVTAQPLTPPPAPAAAPAPAPARTPERPRQTPSPPPPAGGALSVRSEPSGAMVTLDGRLVGETPLVLRDLTAGPYWLVVARPGYAPHTERVTIPSGGPERTVAVALEAGVTSPATALGAIEVDSEPRGARVILDGQFVGQTPLRVPEVRPGPHTVTLELANHSSITRRTTVEPGRTARVIANLR